MAVGGATSITTGLLIENESLFPATPTNVISIAVGLVTENESLFPVAVSNVVSITTGMIVENETLFSASLPVIALGGVYNAVEYFPPGSTVAITVFDVIDGSDVAINTSVVFEPSGTGRFIWNAANITVQPTGYQEYGYTMTDGVTIKGGVIHMFDANDSDRLLDIYRRLGLDSLNPLTNKSDGGIEVADIDIEASASGSDIIQTRQ